MAICSVQAVTAAACVFALLSGTALAQATQQMQEQNGRSSKHANEPVQHKVGDTIPACTVAACSVLMAPDVLTTVLFMDFSLHSGTHGGLENPSSVQLWSDKGLLYRSNLTLSKTGDRHTRRCGLHWAMTIMESNASCPHTFLRGLFNIGMSSGVLYGRDYFRHMHQQYHRQHEHSRQAETLESHD